MSTGLEHLGEAARCSPRMERQRQGILARPQPRGPSVRNAETAAAQYEAEQARLALRRQQLSHFEATVLPTAEEEAERKRQLFQDAQLQLAARAAAREEELRLRCAPVTQPCISDTIGTVAPQHVNARAQAERAALEENRRLAEQRAAAQRAARLAEQAEERSRTEWWDRAAQRSR